jgi:2-dehydro-3-deoxyphosphooctonate aldolase (KDO 8-P synthase)|tara:strand:- start:2805 stop:3644 length:840 start_codon:yes stop_codon:yes gene_type:complete
MKELKIQDITLSNKKPFTLIAGLNVLESNEVIEEVIASCISVSNKLGIPYIFKASYDKANRSSINSYRGPGAKKGIKILSDLRSKYQVPVLSDVHTVDEVEVVKNSLDVIQIPAFLCRQTDLVEALANTGLPINIKKAQFMSPSDIENVVNKFKSFGNDNLMICERGTSFGYNNLVVDMVGMAKLKLYDYPVIFDVTHSLQQPGGLGESTAGRRENVFDLARSGMALGIAGLFLETHPDPDKALCDGPCALPLNHLEEFLSQVKLVDDLVKSFSEVEIN